MKRVSAEHRRPMEWLRLYAEFADDPKVQMLSEAMQRRYLMLLCLTRKELIPTRDDSAVAFALRLSAKETQRTKRVLKTAKLIGDDWKPSAWDRRQFASDHSGAQRQKRYRDKHRDSNVTVTATVTAASRHGDRLEGEGEGEERKNQKKSQSQRGEDAEADGERDSSSQAAASQLAQSDGDRKTVMKDSLKDCLPQMKSPPLRARKNGDFEQINAAVEKLITQKICTPEDFDGIARIACITPAQARTSIQQLRERGQLS